MAKNVALRRAPVPPKRGGPSSGHNFPWSEYVWTYARIGRVWPSAKQILPEAKFTALSGTQQQQILAIFEHELVRGYECLRGARWMKESGDHYVSCVKCNKKALSYGAVAKLDRESGLFRSVGGKQRWRCKKACEVNQGVQGSMSLRDGCGAQFCDTTGTPFENTRLAVGLVFAALFYSSATIERLLREGGKEEDALALRHLIAKLQHHKCQPLHERLQRYAQLFCSRILLERCSKITGRKGSVFVLNGLKGEQGRLLALMGDRQRILTELQKSYERVRVVLGRLKQVDRSIVNGKAVDPNHRCQLVADLNGAVTRVTVLGQTVSDGA